MAESKDSQISRRGLPDKNYRTGEIAKLASVHPNTVRLYEQWKFISPVPRDERGYRIFLEKHLDQMLFARKALPGPYPGGWRPVHKMVHCYIEGDYEAAIEEAEIYHKNVLDSERRAKEASEILDRWGRGEFQKERDGSISRKAVSRRLELSVDTLRNWERNHLVVIEKNEKGYCQYSPENVDRIKIIAMLRNAGFAIYTILQTMNHFDRGMRKGLSDYLKEIEPDRDLYHITGQWLLAIEMHKRKSKDLIAFLKKKSLQYNTTP